ncbi:rod shape-determining protein MreD [Paracoccus suum]|uniref:Rod shape-determining protein MreD n=1 Tax=Paracoccus suum TaxID=2259340 RepID=A0A344PJ81_9RHOB|nr:rod shape-determining protein MreD [Paracoccus suum]AXC49436.1 rod shape-determining protein MreD [Paracoccus suum]
MIEAPTRRRLIGQSIYVCTALLLLFLRLLPLHPGAVTWPGPDLLLCLTLAWVLRRPEQVPVVLIAAVFLIEDVLLQRPIGLWAAIAVLGTEAARHREVRWREHAFMVEWLRVGVLIAVMILAQRIAMALFVLPLPALGQTMLQLLATVAAYPPVVLAGHLLFGLRRGTPGDSDAMGYR